MRIRSLDKLYWHAEAPDFPDDLPPERAATHMGMFLVWAIGKDLASPIHYDRRSPLVRRLAARAIKPGEYFLAKCGVKLTELDFSEEGWAFAQGHYMDYLEEYSCEFGEDLGSAFRAPDTWKTFRWVRAELNFNLRSWRKQAEPHAAPDTGRTTVS